MERAAARVMGLLQDAGCDSATISLNAPGPGAFLFERLGSNVQTLNYRRHCPWAIVRPLKKLLVEFNPRAILLTGHSLWATEAILSRRQGTPATLWLHFHHRGVKSSLAWKLIYRQACTAYDRLIFASNFIRDEAVQLYPRVAAISEVIYNPVPISDPPTEDERKSARAKLGLPQSAPIIGNAGWLIARKRFDVFLRVMERLITSGTPVFAVVAGDGPLRGTLERQAMELGISAQVKFLGTIADMKSFYHALDVVLFNSDWDAFPTTPLESMSYGVPTLASCIHSGLHEIFAPSLLPAFYFRTHDIVGLTESAKTLLSSRDLGMLQRDAVARVLSPSIAQRLFVGALNCGPVVANRKAPSLGPSTLANSSK